MENKTPQKAPQSDRWSIIVDRETRLFNLKGAN